jgi:hypothetical protein
MRLSSLSVVSVLYSLRFSGHTLKSTQARNHSDVTSAIKILHDRIILLLMLAFTLEINRTNMKYVPKVLTLIRRPGASRRKPTRNWTHRCSTLIGLCALQVATKSNFSLAAFQPLYTINLQPWLQVRVRVSLRLTVCHSVCLRVDPRLVLMTRCLLIALQLLSCPVQAPCLTRGRFCLLSVTVSSLCQYVHEYIQFYMFDVILYIRYIQGLRQSRLGTAYYALLVIAQVTTPIQTLQRTCTWPPPSLSLFYFYDGFRLVHCCERFPYHDVEWPFLLPA